MMWDKRERDASACMRRHQPSALAPVTWDKRILPVASWKLMLNPRAYSQTLSYDGARDICRTQEKGCQWLVRHASSIVSE